MQLYQVLINLKRNPDVSLYKGIRAFLLVSYNHSSVIKTDILRHRL
jgi:hypothetical protein